MAVLLGAVLLAVSLHSFFRTREPVVNGQSISYWLEAGRWQPVENPEALQVAYAAMDAECVRWLAKELEWKPNPIRDSFARVVNELFGRTMSPFTPGDRRVGAATVLGNLGERAMPAVPALRKATTVNVDPRSLWVRGVATAALIRLGQDSIQNYIVALGDTSGIEKWREAVFALEGLGTNAAPAVPILAGMLVSNQLLTVRFDAVRFLGNVRIDPDLSVPALVTALEDPQLRRSALMSLRLFGPIASNATDAVVACLADTNRGIRPHVEHTLRAINPQKASLLTNNPAQ